MTASDATFVFADIAGFTALTEAHGDDRQRTSWRTSATR
jgi:class 3 adenylate cyclase